MFANPRPEPPSSITEDEESRKRKRAETDQGSPSSMQSQKRRLSPRPQSQSETLPPITNGQPNGTGYTTQEPSAQTSRTAHSPHNDYHWQPQRSSADEGTSETRLREVLGSPDSSSQPPPQSQPNGGTPTIPSMNGHPPPSYASPSDQESPPQPAPNAPMASLPSMTAPQMQKQRKR